MRVFTGTSGFSYKEWRGSFYPDKLQPKAMLEHYSAHLSAVEINNTFYRMPAESMLVGYRERTPEAFRFVLKAPRSITHSRRLRDCQDHVAHLASVASALGSKLGPVLFQLPPNFQADAARLEGFLACLPPGLQAAFEFRHPSWHRDDTYERLRKAGVALCIADVDGDPPVPLATASFTYLRLRREDYDLPQIQSWARSVRQLGVDDAYVFFKHEVRAPELALTFAGCFP